MINLALIGAGRWGKNYLRAVKKLNKVKIKYVCSGSKSLQEISGDYIKLDDYKKLADIKDLDGVIIAVPSRKHLELASFFLSIKKPILLEKPMVVSLQEAEELKLIFEKTKGKLMVGNIFLYNNAFQTFKKLFEEIKDVQYLQFEGYDLGPIRNDISALWDWGPHDVSMCLDLIGNKPFAVSAWAVNSLRPNTKLYDMVYARIMFKNFPVFVKIGWLSPLKKRQIIAVGKENAILFDDTSEKKLTFFDQKMEKRYVPYSVSEPLAKELEDFIQLIKNDKDPISNFEKNFKIVKIIHAMEKSIKKNGEEVKIEK